MSEADSAEVTGLEEPLVVVARPAHAESAVIAAEAAEVAPPTYSYGGGPLLEEVEVVPIFMGRATMNTDLLQQVPWFLGDILVDSPGYLHFLRGYSAGKYTITGKGHLLASHGKSLLDPMMFSADGKSLTQDDFDNALRFFANEPQGADPIPKPNVNTLYLIIIDGSLRLTLSRGLFGTPDESCQNFIGYHYWCSTLGAPFAVATYRCSRFDVPPLDDFPGNRATSLTAAISHELVEAITNPGAFINGTGWSGPMIDNPTVRGEIADNCNLMPDPSYLYEPNPKLGHPSWWVAKYWENLSGTCVAPQRSPPPPESDDRVQSLGG